jgi:competence protein ComEC
MLVPHHGSKTSSTDAFIDAVAPRLGILSVGYRNRFHHPNDAVVARYRGRGIALRRTDAEGALRIVLGAGAPAFAVTSRYACAYWSERECAREPR